MWEQQTDVLVRKGMKALIAVVKIIIISQQLSGIAKKKTKKNLRSWELLINYEELMLQNEYIQSNWEAKHSGTRMFIQTFVDNSFRHGPQHMKSTTVDQSVK